MVGHKEEWLFTALADAAQPCIRDFNWQYLTNTAWAFATVGHKEEQLFTAKAAAAESLTQVNVTSYLLRERKHFSWDC